MTDTKTLAVAYYTALGEKNIEAIKKILHPDIQFTDPQETVTGKEAVLKAAKGFMSIFNTLTIRTKFGSEDQAMIVYEVCTFFVLIFLQPFQKLGIEKTWFFILR